MKTSTGVATAFACASVIAVSVVPCSTTPPFATPASTGRVCVTDPTTVPVGATSWVRSFTCVAPAFGDTMLLN